MYCRTFIDSHNFLITRLKAAGEVNSHASISAKIYLKVQGTCILRVALREGPLLMVHATVD
jgi:hypothetical protein